MPRVFPVAAGSLPTVSVDERFEGPLDELLDLIQSHRLPVSAVSLARITDAYLERVRDRAARSLEEMVLVLWIVATLLYLKARNLLPQDDAFDDEEAQVSELTHRLALLERARRLGAEFSKGWGRGVLARAPRIARSTPPHNEAHLLLEGVSAVALQEAALRLAAKARVRAPSPRRHTPVVRVAPTVSLTQALERVRRFLRAGSSWTFCVRHYTREDAVVFFLAILELVRRGVVEVEMATDHATLTIWGRGE